MVCLGSTGGGVVGAGGIDGGGSDGGDGGGDGGGVVSVVGGGVGASDRDEGEAWVKGVGQGIVLHWGEEVLVVREHIVREGDGDGGGCSDVGCEGRGFGSIGGEGVPVESWPR